MKTIFLRDKNFDLWIPFEEIDKDIERLAVEINKEEKDKKPIFLVVLNGSFVFAADLLKKLNIECEVEFIKVKSYEGMQQSGNIQLELQPDWNNIAGRKVIIVEDIVDTGKTLRYLYDLIKSKGVNEIDVCTLFFKPEAYRDILPLKWIGRKIDNRFIVGYGLDYDGLGRNLKDIYVFNSNK